MPPVHSRQNLLSKSHGGSQRQKIMDPIGPELDPLQIHYSCKLGVTAGLLTAGVQIYLTFLLTLFTYWVALI